MKQYSIHSSIIFSPNFISAIYEYANIFSCTSEWAAALLNIRKRAESEETKTYIKWNSRIITHINLFVICNSWHAAAHCRRHKNTSSYGGKVE